MAVISHALWQRLYAGDPRVTGRTIELNGRGFTVIIGNSGGETPVNVTYGRKR